MADKSEQHNVELKLRVPDNLRQGSYANAVNVLITSNDELILDFVFIHPQEKSATLVSRTVLPLKVAKSLNMILQSQLGRATKT